MRHATIGRPEIFRRDRGVNASLLKSGSGPSDCRYMDRDDRWRTLSKLAQVKREESESLTRFSRPLMITSALILLLVGALDLLK